VNSNTFQPYQPHLNRLNLQQINHQHSPTATMSRDFFNSNINNNSLNNNNPNDNILFNYGQNSLNVVASNQPYISNEEIFNAAGAAAAAAAPAPNIQISRSIGEMNLYSRSSKRVNSTQNRPLVNNCKTDGQEQKFRSNRRDDDDDQSGGGRNGRMTGSGGFNHQFNYNSPNQNSNGARNWYNQNQNQNSNGSGGYTKRNDFCMKSDEDDARTNLKSSYVVEVADEFIDADLSMYNEVFVEDDYDEKLNEKKDVDESDGEIDYEYFKNHANNNDNGLKRTTNFTNYKASLISIKESAESDVPVLNKSSNRESEDTTTSSDLNDSRNEMYFLIESDNTEKHDDVVDHKLSKLNNMSESEKLSVLDDKKKDLENVERHRGKLLIFF
jgi:hypothetical protein